MIIMIGHMDGHCTAIHLPMWMVLNRFMIWILWLVIRRFAQIQIRLKEMYRALKVLRHYAKCQPDFRLVEISSRSGSRVAVWL